MSIISELAEECKISNFAVLLANGWIHCCDESNSVECAEDEDATVVVLDVVAEPKLGDFAICSVDMFTSIVGFFFPESNLPCPVFDISVQVQDFKILVEWGRGAIIMLTCYPCW